MPISKDSPTPHASSPPDAADSPLTPFREMFAAEAGEFQPPEPDSPRGRILKAARELFAEHGFDGTSTRAVSEAAGVNLAMIHYYYGSKEQLYQRILAGEIFGLRQRAFQAIPEGTSPDEALITLPIRLMSVLRSDPIRAALLRREIASGGSNAVHAIHALGQQGPLGVAQLFERAYSAAVQEGHLRDLPPTSVRECLISIAFSSLLFSPMLSAVAGRDFEDETVWQEWKQTWSTLLRQGLLVEKKS